MRLPLATLRRIHAVNRVAPVACLVALLAAGAMLSHRATGDRGQAVARARSVRSSLADVPFVGGNWVGADCPLPAGATEILMPTAVLSRRFTELGTGRRATLGIIHCGDVRDMHGHHPPSCYPASGWHPREGGHDRAAIVLDGERFDANLYRFGSTDASGAVREVSVIGFFILPDGTITSDMAQLGSRAAKLEISRLGVAQIQIVMDGWPSIDDMAAAAQELIDLIPPACIRALKGVPVDGLEAEADAAETRGVTTGSNTGAIDRIKLHGVSDATPRSSTTGEEP